MHLLLSYLNSFLSILLFQVQLYMLLNSLIAGVKLFLSREYRNLQYMMAHIKSFPLYQCFLQPLSSSLQILQEIIDQHGAKIAVFDALYQNNKSLIRSDQMFLFTMHVAVVY